MVSKWYDNWMYLDLMWTCMVEMYLWRMNASAAPTASAVLAATTPDSKYSLFNGGLQYGCYKSNIISSIIVVSPIGV